PEERAEYLRAAFADAFSPEAIAAQAGKSGITNKLTALPINSTNPISKGPPPARAWSERAAVEKGATALLKPATPAETKLPAPDMEAQLLETIEVTTSDFEGLAKARAQRVKEYLLKTGQVESERIFLTQSNGETVTRKGSRV